jgi:hypothetical protein
MRKRKNPSEDSGNSVGELTIGVALGTLIAFSIMGVVIYIKYGQQIQSAAAAVSPSGIAATGLSSLTSLFSSSSGS